MSISKELKYAWSKVCDSKKKHRSRWLAQNQIREDIKKDYYDEGDKHPYDCPLCGFWHVGNKQ